MDSDGTPWRPLVHILDISQAAACTIEAGRKIVHNETFNVGDNDENYQVKDIAKIVSETFPGCTAASARAATTSATTASTSTRSTASSPASSASTTCPAAPSSC